MQSPLPSYNSIALVVVSGLAIFASGRAQDRSPSGAAARAIAPFAPTAAPNATLKEAYKGVLYVGVAMNSAQIDGQSAQGDALIAKEFSSISPENVLKWDATEPEEGKFKFEEGDRFVQFGEAHQMFIIGHNLCWNQQLPGWVSQPAAGQDKLTKEVLLERLHRHIQNVAGHYRGQVGGWDVVNEAILDGSGAYRDSVFYKVTGKEYLVMAFKWAREADPHAELYYNDYNLDQDDAKRATAVELVKYLREQGAPIDGIGLQGHYNLTYPSADKIDETIKIFAGLGLKVMITELDVQAISNAAISGAVGAFPTTQPNAPRPGAITPDKSLPPIDIFKRILRLTDQQVAAVAAVLADDVKTHAAAAGDATNLAQARDGTIQSIRQLLTGEQQPRLTFLLSGRAGRRAGPAQGLTEEQQQALAKRYAEIFTVFRKNSPALTRVTVWGLRDADSWRRYSSPLLFDDDFQRKPAYDAVIAAAK